MLEGPIVYVIALVCAVGLVLTLTGVSEVVGIVLMVVGLIGLGFTWGGSVGGA